jgi:uncharacterized protein YgiM (DUF1202 family)
VKEIGLVSIVEDSTGWLVALELIVEPGFNTLQTAESLRQLAYNETGNRATTEFWVILDDCTTVTDYSFWTYQDDWIITPLTLGSACDNTQQSDSLSPVLGTRYIAGSASTVNVRGGPGTDYGVVGSLAFGTPITITGETNGWYRIEFDGREGWVLGTLTSPTQPQTSSGGGAGGSSSVGSSGQPLATPQSPDVPPVPGADESCMTGFDFSVCSQYQPAPKNCDEVVARGIPERVAACCFPERDGNNNGLACYGS